MVHEVPDISNFLAEVFGMLKSGGRFLVAEPTHHVKAEAELQQILAAAKAAGFVLREQPNIRFSRTLLLEK
jgi:ubiquinone/menaquinone biosynthesis C-methylase UbiE